MKKFLIALALFVTGSTAFAQGGYTPPVGGNAKTSGNNVFSGLNTFNGTTQFETSAYFNDTGFTICDGPPSQCSRQLKFLANDLTNSITWFRVPNVGQGGGQENSSEFLLSTGTYSIATRPIDVDFRAGATFKASDGNTWNERYFALSEGTSGNGTRIWDRRGSGQYEHDTNTIAMNDNGAGVMYLAANSFRPLAYYPNYYGFSANIEVATVGVALGNLKNFTDPGPFDRGGNFYWNAGDYGVVRPYYLMNGGYLGQFGVSINTQPAAFASNAFYHQSVINPGDTITLGTTTYTFVNTPVADFDIQIAGSFTDSLNNFQCAMESSNVCGSCSEGTTFIASVANPDAGPTGDGSYPISCGQNFFFVYARVAGAAGNAIVSTETGVQLYWAYGATLSNGTDAVLPETVTATVVDTTPSITDGDVQLCGYATNPNNPPYDQTVVCETLDFSGGAGAETTTQTFQTVLYMKSSSFATLGGAGDETIELDWDTAGQALAPVNLVNHARSEISSQASSYQGGGSSPGYQTNLIGLRCIDIIGCDLVDIQAEQSDLSSEMSQGVLRFITIYDNSTPIYVDDEATIDVPGPLTLNEFDVLQFISFTDGPAGISKWLLVSSSLN